MILKRSHTSLGGSAYSREPLPGGFEPSPDSRWPGGILLWRIPRHPSISAHQPLPGCQPLHPLRVLSWAPLRPDSQNEALNPRGPASVTSGIQGGLSTVSSKSPEPPSEQPSTRGLASTHPVGARGARACSLASWGCLRSARRTEAEWGRGVGGAAPRARARAGPPASSFSPSWFGHRFML